MSKGKGSFNNSIGGAGGSAPIDTHSIAQGHDSRKGWGYGGAPEPENGVQGSKMSAPAAKPPALPK